MRLTFSSGNLASILSESNIIPRYSIIVKGLIVLCLANGTYYIKRELLQLLGHINFATRVIILCRTFASYLLTLATSEKELEHWVHLNSDCREDLRMWF
jgi:hypothetical protein